MRIANRFRQAICRIRSQAAVPGGGAVRWPTYLRVLISSILLFYLAAVTLIAVIDPWNALPGSVTIVKRPMLSLNQRLLYPMLIRTGRFDSFIFGSSTGMLIDPENLGRELGGRFINLALTDGQAWEQLESLQFVMSQNPKPRTLMFAIDGVWCTPDIGRKDHEIRRFPLWIYRELSWRNIWRLLNAEAFTNTLNTIKYQFGLFKPPIRDDGYWAFAGRERNYDLEVARKNIYGSNRRSPDPPLDPPDIVPDEVRNAWAYPWLDRMAQALATVPHTTQVLFAAMPVHAIAQPQPGSAAAQREAACKERIARIAASRGSILIDFRIRSAVTQTDANYWDHLHYRIGIARKIEQSLGAAVRSQQPDLAGFWRIIESR